MGSNSSEQGAGRSRTVAASGVKRLTWRTDADHRTTHIAGGLPNMVGVGDGALLGRVFPDALREFGCDPDNRLADVFRHHPTWTGLVLAWPMAGTGETVTVSLGGVPSFDAARRFTGFRGFGLIERASLGGEDAPGSGDGRMIDAAGEPAPSDQVAAEQAGPESHVQPDTPAGLPVEGARHPIGDGTRSIPTPDANEVPLEPVTSVPERPLGEPASAKVVALRPNQWTLPYGLDRPASERRGDLSSVERLAFHEIARTLAARLDGDAAPDARDRVTLAVEDVAFEAAGDVGALPVGPSAPPRLSTSLLDAVPVALLLMAVEGERPVFANAAFSRLTGYGSVDALVRAGGVTHLLGGLNVDRHGAEADDHPFPIVEASGAVSTVEGRFQTIEVDGQHLCLATLRPATERTQQARDLEFEFGRRDAELAELRTLLDVFDAMAVFDRQGGLVMMNRPAERLFGCDRNTVAGEEVTALLALDSHAAALALMNDVSSGRRAAGSAAVVQGRVVNGAGVALEVRAYPLGGSRICLGFRDQPASAPSISGEASRPREVDGDPSRANFLAKISHEIRTPLNAILGFTEVILDERFGPVGNPRYKDYLKDIHQSGVQVMDLVSDLLSLSRLEGQQLAMQALATDINHIVGECVAAMQPDAHRERVIMRLSLLPGLPEALIDERAFRQAITYVLTNAVRFNEPGGQVIVSTALNGSGNLVVRVRDTGVGMSDAEVESAMDPFRHATTSTQNGGRGMGLPLTKALMEANNAAFNLKSRKNEGTLVEIILKACPPEPMRVPAE